MKPGKYFLEANMPYSLSGTYIEKIGSASDNAGNTITISGPTQSYNVDLAPLAEKYVEITKEGETISIKLNSQGYTLYQFRDPLASRWQMQLGLRYSL